MQSSLESRYVLSCCCFLFFFLLVVSLSVWNVRRGSWELDRVGCYDTNRLIRLLSINFDIQALIVYDFFLFFFFRLRYTFIDRYIFMMIWLALCSNYCSLVLELSISLAHSHTHTHTHTLSHSLTHTVEYWIPSSFDYKYN